MNAIVVIDATPFRQWYEAHYALPLGHKKNTKLTEAEEQGLNKKRSRKTEKKYKERQKEAKVEQALEDQFASGRVLASIPPDPVNADDQMDTSWKVKNSSSTSRKSSPRRATSK